MPIYEIFFDILYLKGTKGLFHPSNPPNNERRCTSRIPYLFIRKVAREEGEVGEEVEMRASSSNVAGTDSNPHSVSASASVTRLGVGGLRLHRPRHRADRAPVSLLAVRTTAAQTLQPFAGGPAPCAARNLAPLARRPARSPSSKQLEDPRIGRTQPRRRARSNAGRSRL